MGQLNQELQSATNITFHNPSKTMFHPMYSLLDFNLIFSSDWLKLIVHIALLLVKDTCLTILSYHRYAVLIVLRANAYNTN